MFLLVSFCDERIYYPICTDLTDDEVNGELIVVTQYGESYIWKRHHPSIS